MGSLRPPVFRARFRLALGVGALALTLLVGAPAAYAATITVNTTADELNADGDCSLREAVEAANTNAPVDACPAGQPGPIVDVITFGVTGTITITNGRLTVTDALTISGPGVGSLSVSGLGFNVLYPLIEVAPSTTLAVRDFTVEKGGNGIGPGGIENHGTLSVSNMAFSANFGTGGAAIGNDGPATFTVTESTFSSNTEPAIANRFGGLGAVSDSTFVDNAANQGGAIQNFGATLTVSGSTFARNQAFGSGTGGAIANLPFGTLTVINSTFSENTSVNMGGAIYTFGDLVVKSSTFDRNSAPVGGGIFNHSGTASLSNTVVANSPSGGNCSGVIIDGGGNISWPDTTCPGTNVDPLLDPAGLQDNGGPTQTIALQPGSPAIDAAVACPPPATDQRGVARPQGAACDIGAFELETALRIPQHFLRYQLNQPEFAGETVTLVDQFGALTVRLEEAEWLMNPAEKRRTGHDPEPIQRAAEHYVCYGLPYMSTADRTVAVENQFVDSTLRVGRPLTLCTPASKTHEGTPGPPPADLDHLVCYDVRGETPLFPSETMVVRDQFGERTVRIDRARELCNPAEKRRAGHEPEPILRPDEHLVCYRITTQSPAFAALRVNTNDQFNSLQTLRVRTLERVCVPSTKA